MSGLWLPPGVQPDEATPDEDAALQDVHSSELRRLHTVAERIQARFQRGGLSFEEATRFIIDSYAEVGVVVEVGWNDYFDESLRLLRSDPEITVISIDGRTAKEGFDHEREAWEVQHNVLGNDPNPGAIQPDGSIKSVPQVTSLSTNK